jgi:hypothetical protein
MKVHLAWEHLLKKCWFGGQPKFQPSSLDIQLVDFLTNDDIVLRNIQKAVFKINENK